METLGGKVCVDIGESASVSETTFAQEINGVKQVKRLG